MSGRLNLERRQHRARFRLRLVAQRKFRQIEFGRCLEVGQRLVECLALSRRPGLRVVGHEPIALQVRVDDGGELAHTWIYSALCRRRSRTFVRLSRRFPTTIKKRLPAEPLFQACGAFPKSCFTWRRARARRSRPTSHVAVRQLLLQPRTRAEVWPRPRRGPDKKPQLTPSKSRPIPGVSLSC